MLAVTASSRAMARQRWLVAMLVDRCRLKLQGFGFFGLPFGLPFGLGIRLACFRLRACIRLTGLRLQGFRFTALAWLALWLQAFGLAGRLRAKAKPPVTAPSRAKENPALYEKERKGEPPQRGQGRKAIRRRPGEAYKARRRP